MTQVATMFYSYNSDTGQVEYNLELSTSTIDDSANISQDFIKEAAVGVIGAIKDVIDDAVEKAGGSNLAKIILTKPIYAVGFTLEYLTQLKEEQTTNGNDGFQTYISAGAQAAASEIITYGITAALLPAEAGIFTTLAIGVVAGVITKEIYESKFFNDGTQSAEDKLGEFIREFDLDSAKDALYGLADSADATLTNVQDTLSTLVSSATTLGSVTSSFLTSLTQAEATQPVYRRDPLTLDLDGDGIDLVSLSNSSTFFDLDNDGLREQVGWVGADDGLLVYDSNNNSLVDNVTELFGYENEDGRDVSAIAEKCAAFLTSERTKAMLESGTDSEELKISL